MTLVQVNEFVKRVRAAKIHCLIMGHLRKQMPAMMGKQKAQEKLLRDLPNQFSYVQREHHLPAGIIAWASQCVVMLIAMCSKVLPGSDHGLNLLAHQTRSFFQS